MTLGTTAAITHARTAHALHACTRSHGCCIGVGAVSAYNPLLTVKQVNALRPV